MKKKFNIRWYENLLKGKYRLLRAIRTIVNFSVLIAMLCLEFSGIVMSRYVFSALSIHGPMATAKSMHREDFCIKKICTGKQNGDIGLDVSDTGEN